jgi:hypothetical protein
MLRAMMFLATFIIFAGTNPALADWKSDCLNGVAMIKAELKKKHPQPVFDQLRGLAQSSSSRVSRSSD